MKVTKTVTALSSQAFDRQLSDEIYQLEAAGLQINGIQVSNGLIRTAVIIYDDQLTFEQRQEQFAWQNSVVMRVLRTLADLLLIGLAFWLVPAVVRDGGAPGGALTILVTAAACLALLELLNAMVGLSIRSLAIFGIVLAAVKYLLQTAILTKLSGQANLIVAAGLLLLAVALGRDVPKKIRQLWQSSHASGNDRYRRR